MYIDNDNTESLQNETGNSESVPTESPEASARNSISNNDPGWAPISPETPSWGPPADTSDPGWAPISPETPSWGPPADTSDPGWAPISPETPSWGPPSSGGGSVNFPVIIFPGQTGSTTSRRLSNARFLYAATGQPPINIWLGNQRVINRMQFGNSTPYYLGSAGYQTIRVTNAITGALLYRGSFYFRDGDAYTFAIVNNGSGISLMQLTDMPCRTRNAACVRAVNLSPNSGPVDIFLSGLGRVFQSVDTFGTTSYQSILQGAYRAFVSEALPCANSGSITITSSYVECNNTRIALLDTTNINLMNGVTYTLYIIGRAYQTPAVQILSLESDLVY